MIARRTSSGPCTLIRVFILDDVRVFRDAVAAHLRKIDNLEVVGVGALARPGLEALQRSAADVTLVNVSTPNGVESVRAVLAAVPRAKVIAIGLPESEQEVISHAEAGIFGYLMREESLDDLVARVSEVSRGEMPMSARLSGSLLRRVATFAGRQHEQGLSTLTSREAEIAQLIGEGLSNKEIARRLSIEVRTVKNHVHNIFEKLRVSSRSGVATLVAREYRTVPRTHKP